jgi:hypothetical protein
MVGGALMISFRRGKRPAQPARPQLRLTARHLAALPAPPPSVDYGAGLFPLYGNDLYGCCVEAGVGHQVGQYTLHSTGAEALFTDADILNAYSAITGFRADDPFTDLGTYTQDAMTWWRRTGLAGHKILMFASLDLTDVTALRQAVALFGAVGVGFNFPASAMDQFNAGRPWTVVKGSPLEGGHYVIATGYDSAWLRTKTWGTEQLMAWSFLAAYADEAWVVITQEMADNAGVTFSGVDLYGLGQDFAALTGQPNPIPVQPTPVPLDVDAVFAAVLKPWAAEHHIGDNHRTAVAGKAWLQAKGL